MASYEVLLEYLKGKHTTGQLTNFLKYLLTSNKEIVSWQPIFISIFLTYRCNLNCDMCLTHSSKFDNIFGQKYSQDIDFNFYKQILNRYNKAFEVFLIGNGEPLLHNDLFAMIDYASDVMKMRVSACSNGILVGKYTNKIINSKLNTFYISLNGHTSDEYQRMTGMRSDLFQNICENIKELANKKKEAKSKMNLVVTIILDKSNYKDLNSMIKFTKSLGVDGVNFFQFLPVDQEGFTAKERCLFNDDLSVVKLFSEMDSIIKNEFKFNISLPPLLDKDMSNNRNCSVPFTHVCIDGDGNVGGCSCQMLNLNNNENFQNENVWNGGYFQTLRKRFLNSEYSLMQPCQRCYNNSSQKKALWHKR